MGMNKEEIKKALVSHYIGFFDSSKSACESDPKLEEAYVNGQKEEIEQALDEIVSEIKEKYNIN